MWASMYAAYDALSGKMQRMLSDLTAIHNTGRAFAVAANRKEEISGEHALKMVSAEHPVVRSIRDPAQGPVRKFALHIVNQGNESRRERSLLRFLFAHIETPDFTCRFRWRANSIAMWDNRCTQHRAIGDHLKAPRHLERVAIVANQPAP